jgi:heterodisulfide reductase subunit A
MTSALSLAEQGFEVYLVEKDTDLGGMARRIHYTLEGLDVQAYLGDVIRKVYQHPSIHVSTDATITEASGFVGNFITKVTAERMVKEIRHGITIIATGAEEYKPTEYLYGKDDRVLTQLELEERIAKGEERLINSKSLVMIQCVGCRQADRNYCARICCSHSIKNALKLKETNPEVDIYILFRDVRTYGFKEDYYREASNKDVKFIRYEPDDKPQVEAVEEDGRRILRVTVTDPILGKKLAIDADLLALAAAVIPSATTHEISKLFKVPLNPDGFFQEAHAKLRPVDFAANGVFLCGTAHYPKHLSEAVSQAYGAAGRAATILSKDKLATDATIAHISEELCVGCRGCIDICPYGAISYDEKKAKCEINAVLCKGCGGCAATCPSCSIRLDGFRHDQIYAQIEQALG